MSRSEERERRQIKVFTKWVNSHLRKKGVEVDDLGTCFQDGINLCFLYELISDEKLPKYNLKPRGMIQKTNNLAIVLKKINSFVEECGIRLQYSPQQIASGDSRQVLGMLWIMITKFIIPESEESLSRKRSLLRWVQRVTEPYDNVDVKNFTRSWNDGLAFNALLDQFDNSLMDYSSLTADDPAKNCENAFATAEKLGIYRLLDVEDITELDVPDEKSVMTYVSTMYQFFHSQAGRKLEQDAKQLVIDIGRLLEWLRKAIARFQVPEPWSGQEGLEEQLDECRGLERILQDFNAEKARFANVKSNMYLKVANIQRIQRNERLKVFNPPKEQNMGVLHRQWSELNETVIKYSSELRAEIKRIEDLIRNRDENWIALVEKNNREGREAEKARLDAMLKEREDEEDARKTDERKKRDEWIARTLADAEEKRKQVRQWIENEIDWRDKEEDDREHEERRVRDEDIAKKEAEANEKREDEKAVLASEINRREQEDSRRREEERKRREMIIKQQEEKLAAELQEKRAAAEKAIADKIKEEEKKRQALRAAKDEEIEKMQAAEFKKNAEMREKIENEIKEKIAKEAEEVAKKREAQDEFIEKKEAEENAAREKERNEKESAIAEKLERERKERADERERVIKEKIAKEEDEKAKLEAYDSEATTFLAWISENQATLTHTEEVGEDEEDESTDEETRNKRKEAAVEVKEKIKPALEKWQVLVDTKIEQWGSIPCNELQYAMDTFLFALVGEESASLKEIRKFKFPDEE